MLPNPAPDVELEGPEPHLNINPPLPNSGMYKIVNLNYMSALSYFKYNVLRLILIK